MNEHATETRAVGNRWVTTCSCGWTYTHRLGTTAMLTGEQHVKAARAGAPGSSSGGEGAE